LVVTFTSRAAGRLQSPAINARLGATTLHSAALGRVQVVQVDPGRRDSLISAYSTQPGVQGVSLDRAVSVMETPTDPEYSFDTGFGYTDGWSLDAIHAPTAWNLSHGDGVRVAVLDTGIWKEHPDLAGQVVDEQDFTSSATGAADAYGHGTHVAGIIAAVENDATGSAGVAPRAKLLNG